MPIPIQDPITGSEPNTSSDSAYNALVEFYRAFNTADFGLMAQNWLQTSDASMSNPLGGVKRGWNEIATVYENIFNGPARVYVEYYDYTIYRGQGFFQAVGRERGFFEIGDGRIDLVIRTSRTYLSEGDGYRQLHHHGSIEDPALLAQYQAGVMTGKVE